MQFTYFYSVVYIYYLVVTYCMQFVVVVLLSYCLSRPHLQLHWVDQ